MRELSGVIEKKFIILIVATVKFHRHMHVCGGQNLSNCAVYYVYFISIKDLKKKQVRRIYKHSCPIIALNA